MSFQEVCAHSNIFHNNNVKESTCGETYHRNLQLPHSILAHSLSSIEPFTALQHCSTCCKNVLLCLSQVTGYLYFRKSGSFALWLKHNKNIWEAHMRGNCPLDCFQIRQEDQQMSWCLMDLFLEASWPNRSSFIMNNCTLPFHFTVN